MKYLSVVIIAILMMWTWSVINSEANVPFETHAGIQTKLSEIIVDAIKTKKPTASDIKMNQIWTEPFKEGSVKAHFSYQFTETSSDGVKTESNISGEGLLEKHSDDNSGLEKWILSKVKTTSDTVTFNEAIVISTNDEPASNQNSAEPTSDSNSAPKQDPNIEESHH